MSQILAQSFSFLFLWTAVLTLSKCIKNVFRFSLIKVIMKQMLR